MGFFFYIFDHTYAGIYACSCMRMCHGKVDGCGLLKELWIDIMMKIGSGIN